MITGFGMKLTIFIAAATLNKTRSKPGFVPDPKTGVGAVRIKSSAGILPASAVPLQAGSLRYSSMPYPRLVLLDVFLLEAEFLGRMEH